MWEQIRANKRRSVILITGLATILVLMGFVTGYAFAGPEGAVIGVLVATLIWVVQLLAAFAGGEKLLISSLNARELARDDSPRLFNIVEEMVIASGLGYMPRILLIDEQAPNAFAIGTKPETSAIAVTSGLMVRLNRDELQGVIAHEVGHLVNRDVRFMTIAAVMLGTIIILSEVMWQTVRFGGRINTRSSSRDNSAAQFQAVMLVLALTVGLLGPFLARILYFAASRSREYLADASSAQYTRYPEGLASALEKIERGARTMAVSRAIAPMFIVNPRAAATDDTPSDNMFSSHPATVKRVNVLRAMGGGAGLAAYEAAYRKTLHKGLFSSRSLAEAPAVEARQGSNEGPIKTRQEAKATVQRKAGYLAVQCDCGMEMRIPPAFENEEVVCIRCGAKIPLPPLAERYKQQLALYGVKPDGSAAEDPATMEPLQYERQGRGWETVTCSCGNNIQLGPAFQAPRLRCPKCKRNIQVKQPARV